MTMLKITDVDDCAPTFVPGPKPPRELGSNLDTIEKARTWLSHPSNWIKSNLFIVKWDGYVPYVEESRGRAMAMDPSDDSLPYCVVLHQKMLRERGIVQEEAPWRDDE